MKFLHSSKLPLAIVILLFAACAAQAEDWSHWRGSSRSDVSTESSGWKNGKWPLREAWHTSVGEGSSSPLVVGGQFFTMGWQNNRDQVVCLDAKTGKVVWRQDYASPKYGRRATGDEGLYSGPSSTPEFDGESGYLYTLGIDGDLNCWNTRAQGKVVWSQNLYEKFDVPQRPKVGRSGLRDYGYTSSPLVHGKWLIVEVGAKEGNLIAFDKLTGKQVWSSQSTSPAGHNAGPTPITVENTPCVAVHNHDGLLVARLDQGQEGKTVATYPWVTSFANNIASISVHGDSVLLTSAYNQNRIERLKITLKGAEKVWQREEASKVCTPLIYEGRIYWAWENVMCLDFETGKVHWKGGRCGDPGSCIVTSDSRLIVWAGGGDLSLVETAKRSPDRYTELAAKKGIGKSDAWPHVVLADKRLYCKDRSGQIVCLELTP